MSTTKKSSAKTVAAINTRDQTKYTEIIQAEADYTSLFKAFTTANTSGIKATDLFKTSIGYAEGSTVADAPKLEKGYAAIRSDDGYAKASVQVRDAMRSLMSWVRKQAGYTVDKKGVVTVKVAVKRGTKAKDTSAPARAEPKAVGSIANPSEAAQVVASINTWRAAIDAVVAAFPDMPKEVQDMLIKASFYKALPVPKAKAATQAAAH